MAKAETVPDKFLIFSLLYVKEMHRYIESTEQSNLIESIRKIANLRWSMSELEPLVYDPIFPLLKKIEVTCNTPCSLRKNVAENDPFIYSPYAKSKEKNVDKIIVEEEDCCFILTLDNPYSFAIEIQKLSLL